MLESRESQTVLDSSHFTMYSFRWVWNKIYRWNNIWNTCRWSESWYIGIIRWSSYSIFRFYDYYSGLWYNWSTCRSRRWMFSFPVCSYSPYCPFCPSPSFALSFALSFHSQLLQMVLLFVCYLMYMYFQLLLITLYFLFLICFTVLFLPHQIDSCFYSHIWGSSHLVPQLYNFCAYCLFAEKPSYTHCTYNQNLNVAHPYVTPLYRAYQNHDYCIIRIYIM